MSKRINRGVDTSAIRKQSLCVVSEFGYAVNPELPLLDESMTLRCKDDLVDRALAMHCVAACAVGFDRAPARAWYEHERLNDFLTPDEMGFLSSDEEGMPCFLYQIEGIWALVWCFQLVGFLDFRIACSDDLATLLPDLRKGEPSRKFRGKARMRTKEEIMEALDLAYCLHWALVDANIRHRPLPASVKPHIIIERRRALEWTLSDESWDSISLDT